MKPFTFPSTLLALLPAALVLAVPLPAAAQLAAGRPVQQVTLTGAAERQVAEIRLELNAATGSPVTNSVTYAYLANSDLVRTATAKAGAATVMTTTRGWDYGYRLRSVQNVLGAAGATVNAYTYDYDDVDRRTRATLADSSAWAYDYNDRNEVTGASRFWGDQTLVAGQQFEFAYDAIGNRKTMKRGGDETGAGRQTTAYTANNLNQYTAIANPGAVDVLGVATASAVVSVNGQAAYERGEYWWKSVPVANGGGPQWAAVTNTAAGGGTSNVVGRVYVPPAAEALAYDADGNLTNDGRWTYAWDAENRLVRLETAPAAVSHGVPRLRLDFGYDWQGRRLSKTVLTNWNGTAYTVTNESRFLYDGWNLVAELNATNAPVRSHVWGLDLGGALEDEGNVGGMVELLDHSTGPPTRWFAAYDGNANLTALVKADQTVGAQYEYGPFGELLRATGPAAAANPVRWSSRYWDAEADLIYYGWRYYSPAQGRWLGRDPIEEADAVNLYAYVRNNPVAMFDRLGQSSGSSADNQAAMSGGSAVSRLLSAADTTNITSRSLKLSPAEFDLDRDGRLNRAERAAFRKRLEEARRASPSPAVTNAGPRKVTGARDRRAETIQRALAK